MKGLFIAYLTAGQKGLDFSIQAALALVKGGVDILEIGVPFSDPIADGPVIQNAANESLKLGTTIFDVLELIKKIRKQTNVPIILFSYYNPILQAESKRFFQVAKDVGVDGILVVDLPLEEAAGFEENCRKVGVDPIFIIAPSTPKKRIKLISKHARRFLYYACRKGTTGMQSGLPSGFKEKIQEIKSVVSLPVVTGFGIASCESAQKVVKYADGFVVGSLFVDAIAKGASAKKLTELAKQIDPRGRV